MITLDTDKALHLALSREHGWIMPVGTNVLRKILLRIDVGLPGHFYLTLTGDDTTSTEQYDPWTKNRSITGKLYTESDIPEFFTTPQTGGTQFHLIRGTAKYEDYHCGDVDNRRIVANCGASDMPTKRWKKAFLNSCYSGQYYYRVFNHGTLFYTVDESRSSSSTQAFIKAIIDGKDDDGILYDVTDVENAENTIKNINDYHSF